MKPAFNIYLGERRQQNPGVPQQEVSIKQPLYLPPSRKKSENLGREVVVNQYKSVKLLVNKPYKFLALRFSSSRGGGGIRYFDPVFARESVKKSASPDLIGLTEGGGDESGFWGKVGPFWGRQQRTETPSRWSQSPPPSQHYFVPFAISRNYKSKRIYRKAKGQIHQLMLDFKRDIKKINGHKW